MLARYYAMALCLSVCLSVCHKSGVLSKTAKHVITETTLHDTRGIQFSEAKVFAKFQ